MAVATLLAAGVSWLVAQRLGADALTLRHVVIAAFIGALATAIPVVLRIGRDHWGVVVMGAGVARLLLSLGYCYAIREASPDVLSRPLFVGVVAGAVLLLITEVTTAIRILSALERQRELGAPSADATRKTA